MTKVWVLERFISAEEMKKGLIDLSNARKANEGDSKMLDVCDEMIEAYKSRMEKNPDGYWLGYDGKINYRDFCYCAKRTIRNFASEDFEKKFGKSEFRVVKAEIKDGADTWLGYVNSELNDGVLRYLYATL